MRLAALLIGLCVICGGTAAWAQTPDVKREARQRFDRGLTRFNQGDDGGALAEFKRAYELIPHPLVLFNIALVQAAMGEPVKAVASLDKLFGNPQGLPADKLVQARKVRAEQAQRIAKIRVVANVSGARVQLDGLDVGRTPLAAPLAVSSGSHRISIVAVGYAPVWKTISVASGRTETVDIQLEAVEGRLATLKVRTLVPDAEVVVDGKALGRTPLVSPILVTAGTRVVELRRKGYRSARQTVTAVGGTVLELELDPKVDTASLRRNGGQLALTISESEAVVFIDGQPRGAYAQPIWLPAGVHEVRVERDGFFPLSRRVSVPAGSVTTVVVDLEPTAQKRADYQDGVTRQNWVGWLTLGTGALVLAGGTTLAVVSIRQQDKALDDFNEEAPRHESTGDCWPGLPANQRAKDCKDLGTILDDADAAKARIPIGWVVAGAGAVGVGVGAFILLTNDDADRYAPSPESDVFGRLRLTTTPWLSRRAQGLTISGRF